MATQAHPRPMHMQHNHASSSSSSSSRHALPSASPKSPSRPPATHVQAIHDFDPTRVASAVASNASLYLRFKAGDIIRVHTRDERGWWDGEMSTSDEKRTGPRRGWFPSNYVREMGIDSALHRRTESATTAASSPISHRPSHSRNQSSLSHQSQSSITASIQNTLPLPDAYQAVMLPVIQSLTLLENAIETDRITHLQPSTACVISAIKTALEQADCLSKESPTLTKWPVLAKERKLVLVELSRLVSSARITSQMDPGQVDQKSMDAVAKAARGVFGSFQRFLGSASECGAELKERVVVPDERASSAAGPRSPKRSNSRMQEAFKLRAASIGDLRGARKRDSNPPPMPQTAGLMSMRSARGSLRSPLDLTTPMSATFSSSSSGRSSPVSVTSQHRQRASFDANSSTSSLPFDEVHSRTPSVSRKSSQEELQVTVDRTEEHLFSLIAALVGHIHVHERNSHGSSHAHLIEMTRDTVNSIRELLTCVEEIGRDRRVQAIRHAELGELIVAKTELYAIALEIVEATEIVAYAPFDGAIGDEEYNLNKRRLLVATTSTLRVTTECLRALRACMPDVNGLLSNTTPRPGEAGASLRPHPVGARGSHTLSTLHRKASSLGFLQKRYEEDHLGSAVEDDEDEEIVADTSRDEDLTMRPLALALRPPLYQTKSSPMLETSAPGRSRSSSLASPAAPRIQHRSPSRSADLDKFTGDYPAPAPPPPRSTSRPLSAFSIMMPDMARSSASSHQTSNTPQTPPEQSSPILGYLKDDQPSSALPSVQIDGETTPVKRPAVNRSITAPTPNGDIRFWVVAHDYDPREIAFNPDGAMIGASLSVLVEKITPHDGPVEPTFWSTFWVTFRLFTTPEKLLDEVIRRYDLHPPPTVAFGERERSIWIERKVVPVRLRIYNFLKAWLDTHWMATSDDVVLQTMDRFAADKMSRTLPAYGPRLLELVRRKTDPPLSAVSAVSAVSAASATSTSTDRSEKRASATDKLRLSLQNFPPSGTSLPPTPVISKSLHSMLQKATMPNINIIDFDTVELARQLTIMESKLFCAVVPEDLLQTGRRPIPELKALSTLSNQITGWVADSILNEQDFKKRAGLLKFFIKLADKCFAIHNFSTMFALLAGLNSSTIMRLKKTWDALNSKYAAILERLRGVIEHTKNHAAYRARLREVTGPCLPFLGLILTDITFTSDGNPDTRPSTLAPDMILINQDKYTKLGKIAMDFKRYQTPFNFHELEAVQGFLRRVLADRGSTSLDALYRKSLLLEPRTGTEKPNISLEKPGWLGGRI